MVWVLPHFCASSLGRPCRGGSSGKRSQPETKRISSPGDVDVNLPIIIVSKLLARCISRPLGAIWQRCKVPSLWRRLGVFLGPVFLGSMFATPGRRRGAGRRGRATGRAPESSRICGPAHRAQCASVPGLAWRGTLPPGSKTWKMTSL